MNEWQQYPCRLSRRTPSQLYPKRRRNGLQHNESHVIFKEFYGRWPAAFVCHHCDNPRCIEPYHFFEANHVENMKDGVRKGRFPKGGDSPAHLRSQGENDRILDLFRVGYSGRQITDYLNLKYQRAWNVRSRFKVIAHA